ncbi:hypothetical protein T4E_6508 [Trichinella pseudospiralis]|uniref:Uncharacterized protein n=1 Tax=Trichinella pseudospiralis TaxID=6337 RepID=A0A0V0Y876_TRIPS|nr:hypothetical protein T4E_6508 [Trichinella pseudospiralis]
MTRVCLQISSENECALWVVEQFVGCYPKNRTKHLKNGGVRWETSNRERRQTAIGSTQWKNTTVACIHSNVILESNLKIRRASRRLVRSSVPNWGDHSDWRTRRSSKGHLTSNKAGMVISPNKYQTVYRTDEHLLMKNVCATAPGNLLISGVSLPQVVS